MFASHITAENHISCVNTGIKRNYETYNIAKLQILAAVFQLNDLDIEATSLTIQQLTFISVSGICHFSDRYVKNNLLEKRTVLRSELSPKAIYCYEITDAGKK